MIEGYLDFSKTYVNFRALILEQLLEPFGSKIVPLEINEKFIIYLNESQALNLMKELEAFFNDKQKPTNTCTKA